MNVSFILLAFNQENFIKEAISSILNQEWPSLEIIVSDDCSTDSTWTIIEKTVSEYKGKHTVVCNRNQNNLGIAQHFNKMFFEFCHGDIILTADGDDISFPHRTQRTLELFAQNPEIMGLSFGKLLIDKNGNLLPTQDLCNETITKLIFRDYVNSGYVDFCGSSRAFRREVMEFFGPLNFSTGNDIFMFNRCLMMGGYLYSSEKMIYYRIHDNNTEHPKAYTLRNIRLSREQFHADLNLAFENGLIRESDYTAAKKKKIKRILQIFRLNHISHYHPLLFRIILIRRSIKRFFRGIVKNQNIGK